MKKLQWKRLFFGFSLLILIGLGVGYGYFWGRYVQIEMNKASVKQIPEVNCGIGK